MRQTPKMGSNTSVKCVLPALVPYFENAYKDLELVHKGQEAMAIYAQMPGTCHKSHKSKPKKPLWRIASLALWRWCRCSRHSGKSA
ncbi:hypothetical protein NHP21005_13480 [Helicobacter sp. NHP21005]|nr:hypothetical protein NHP21005_13480 [Helicobacter sp. NHP21005]